MATEKQTTKYRGAIEKATRWLLTHRKPGGAVEPEEMGIDSYYKVPWALQITGHVSEALETLKYALSKDWVPSGDFESSHRGQFHHDFYIYPNSWLAIAASRLGDREVSRNIFRFIARFQHPDNGGLCSWRPWASGANRQDMLSTSFAGLVALDVGETQSARKAGDFLVRMKALQPCPDKELHASVDSLGDHTLRVAQDRGTIVRRNVPGQRYYFPGAAVAALAKLYEATGCDEYHEAAQWYFEWWNGCGGDVFHSVRSGKGALGAAYLYEITGEERYGRAATRIADYLVDIQDESGMWPVAVEGGDPLSSYVAEFVVWLSEIARCCLSPTRNEKGVNGI